MTVPPFFIESCGYRGSARYVAVRWEERGSELWLSDDGHMTLGRPEAMRTLWRRDGGQSALELFRGEARESLKPPWLVFDRELQRVSLGCALAVWRMIEVQQQR